MYESPINLTFIDDMVKNIVKQQKEQTEQWVMESIRKLGIDITKEELIKALQYDREQYEKGYQDGLNADKWHPMTEEPKEINERYLTYHEDNTMNTGTWTNCGWFFGCYTKDVIAWQELPKKPNIENF